MDNRSDADIIHTALASAVLGASDNSSELGDVKNCEKVKTLVQSNQWSPSRHLPILTYH